MTSSLLLTVDAIINLAPGLLLLAFPKGLVSALGIPWAEVAFYPNILGAVLFGIGIAMLIERYGGSSGLGLAGAVCINLSGGLVLTAWLVVGSLALPLRGLVILWTLVLVLVGVSTVELLANARDSVRRVSR